MLLEIVRLLEKASLIKQSQSYKHYKCIRSMNNFRAGDLITNRMDIAICIVDDEKPTKTKHIPKGSLLLVVESKGWYSIDFYFEDRIYTYHNSSYWSFVLYKVAL